MLTPHAGELARMLGTDRDLVEAQPLRHARDAAEKYAAVVLLKGRHTLIAAPDGRVRVTTTGTPWLATAGAGDVLGGLIGALLAAGLSDFDAASVGSWLHGAAATLAARGGPITAGEVAKAIPGGGGRHPRRRRDGTIGTHDLERSRRDRGRPRRDPAQRRGWSARPTGCR